MVTFTNFLLVPPYIWYLYSPALPALRPVASTAASISSADGRTISGTVRPTLRHMVA
ncbi:MAG: hypothetical protein ACP5L2_07680 [Conexivisphaera sp.]